MKNLKKKKWFWVISFALLFVAVSVFAATNINTVKNGVDKNTKIEKVTKAVGDKCDKCGKADCKGDCKGKEEHKEGKCKGHKEGECKGHKEGECKGHKEGECKGHKEGECKGHKEGKCKGHKEDKSLSDTLKK